MNNHQRILNRIKELAQEIKNEPYTKSCMEGDRVGWISGEALLDIIQEFEEIYLS
jgi:hypothetical protein